MSELRDQSSTQRPADPNPNRKENHPHDQAQAHPDHAGADRRRAVAAGAGGSELRHRPSHLGPSADSDHEGYDRARDELAVPDPYATEWEPPFRHGPVTDTTLGDTPEHPGLLSQRRVDPTPPNAAPTIAVPAGRPPSRPAGHPSEHDA